MAKNDNAEVALNEPKKKSASGGGKGEAPKKKRGVGRWFKELFSELKKVTWPSFLTVVKQTGVVLLVTVIFLLVMLGMDTLFGWLYKGVLKWATAEGSVMFGGITHALRNIPVIGGMLL